MLEENLTTTTDLPPQAANIRLSGTVLFEGLSANYANPQCIESLVARLNGKTYSLGLNQKQGFTLDIPEQELLVSNGQAIEFALAPNYPIFGVNYDENGVVSRFREMAKLDDQSRYQLDPQLFVKEGNIIQANFSSTPLEQGLTGDFVSTLRHSNPELP